MTVTAANTITAGPSIANQQQVATSNWTANQNYSNVAQSAIVSNGPHDFTTSDGVNAVKPGNRVLVDAGYTFGGSAGVTYTYKGTAASLDLGAQNYGNAALWTGTASGMTVNISVGANGTPVVTLATYGTGYLDGDLVTFNPPNGVGTPVTVQVVTTPDLQQDSGPVNFHVWTANRTYTAQAQSATSGTGTGMTATIVVDQYGHPHATVVSPGTGYQIGDIVSFSPPDSIGNAVDLQVFPVLAQNAAPSPFSAWTPGQIYSTVVAGTSSGAGTGMSARISVDNQGNPTLALGQDIGTGYAVNDTVSFNPPDSIGSPVSATITGTVTFQIVNINWLPNQTYNNVAAVSTTNAAGTGPSLGSGATVNIVTDANGVPKLTLANPGGGYGLGDLLTFSPSGNTADPVKAIYTTLGSIQQLPARAGVPINPIWDWPLPRRPAAARA